VLSFGEKPRPGSLPAERRAEDIAMMRRIVGPEMGVKASGGIRTYEDAAKMIAAGASRIGPLQVWQLSPKKGQ